MGEKGRAVIDSSKLKKLPSFILYNALFVVPILFFAVVVVLLFYTSNQLANSQVTVDPARSPSGSTR